MFLMQHRDNWGTLLTWRKRIDLFIIMRLGVEVVLHAFVLTSICHRLAELRFMASLPVSWI